MPQHSGPFSEQLSHRDSLSDERGSQGISENDSRNATSEPLKITVNDYHPHHLSVLPCSKDILSEKLASFANSTQNGHLTPFYQPMAHMPYLLQSYLP